MLDPKRGGWISVGSVIAPCYTSTLVLKPVLRLSNSAKLAVAVAGDAAILAVAVAGAYLLRLDQLQWLWPQGAAAMAGMALVGVVVFRFAGLYREITRYIGPVFAYRVVKGTALLSLLFYATSFLFDRGTGTPRSVPIIFFLLSTLGIGGSRLFARWLLLGKSAAARGPRVVIFGAGAAGIGLHSALVYARTHQVVAYIDDNPQLVGRSIRGVPVRPTSEMDFIIREHGVNAMLLALPSASRERRRQLAEAGVNIGVQVLTVPTLSEIQDGSARVDQIRPVSIDELLGRTPVAPQTELLQRLVVARNVMVSGAGGSIGSELCRKIIACRPDRLVLLDACEHNLYAIEMELRNWMSANRSDVRLEAVLGSVQDAVLVERLLQANRIQTVYHAAAYKHVPIVERHESVGAETNVIGTYVLAVAAERAGVETFVLVSTDKAVRPTSVMGASKRVAEMVLQGLHQAGSRTRFCMVRFGNVLGSSGSVIPLFREQIARGGPLTVTHPDMVRYFMTSPEAADLILQAGAMAQGGEVFLLDMGEPVRVDDLARNMVRLAGRSVRDAANPTGDIEIQYTGIRPGEKMFEELLIGDVTQPTEHVSIRLGHEPSLPSSLMNMHLDRLRAAIDQRDDTLVRSLLHDMVREASASHVAAN